MDISSLKDFKTNVWWRGAKLLSVVKIDNNVVIFSNADKIKVNEDGRVYLNGQVMCDMPGLTAEQMLDIYLWKLSKKGYKFLD